MCRLRSAPHEYRFCGRRMSTRTDHHRTRLCCAGSIIGHEGWEGAGDDASLMTPETTHSNGPPLLLLLPSFPRPRFSLGSMSRSYQGSPGVAISALSGVLSLRSRVASTSRLGRGCERHSGAQLAARRPPLINLSESGLQLASAPTASLPFSPLPLAFHISPLTHRLSPLPLASRV